MELGGVEALEPRQKGRPSIKRKSIKQSEQSPANEPVKALEARIKQLKWKMSI